MKLFNPENYINTEGYIPGEMVREKPKKVKKCMVSKIVIHKPKEQPKCVITWEEYRKQCEESYTINVVLKNIQK